MQDIRASYYIYSQIINVELLDNPLEQFSRRLTIKGIIEYLDNSPLKENIIKILSEKRFIYLDELVIANKHIVSPKTQFHSSDTDISIAMLGTKISEFERKERIPSKI